MGTPARKIAFVSPHCVMDFTNGAATATLDGLALLARAGFKCEAFCNTHVDAWEEVLIEEVLAQRGARYTVRNARIGQFQGRMIFTSHGTKEAHVPITLFNSVSTRGGWQSPREIGAFLTGCEIFLRKNRPDVVWTYGGDAVSVLLHKIVRGLDIPLLFSLHNFAYLDGGIFHPGDRVVVPTEFARRFYRETIGLECDVLPLMVDPDRIGVDGTHGARINRSGAPAAPRSSYVAFVNPTPLKGVFVFARIAELLARRRPEIPLLLVEGSSKARFLPALGVDLSGLQNLRIMPNSPDARRFLAATKLLVMPSLLENAGLVAIEAMFNGIPVLASTRGGLPETIGDARFLFDIPARYTPESRDLPTAEEVEPWVETIIRLWDDPVEYDRASHAARQRARRWHPDCLAPVEYDRASHAARQRARRWHPDCLAPVYRDFFSRVTHQPSPPLVPKIQAPSPSSSSTGANP